MYQRLIIESDMRTIELSDICTAYLEGYFYAKITEVLIPGQIKSSYLDALKKIAVESVKNYIENSAFSNEEKEEMKNNYEHWADMTLHGIKQRLHEGDKLCE